MWLYSVSRSSHSSDQVINSSSEIPSNTNDDVENTIDEEPSYPSPSSVNIQDFLHFLGVNTDTGIHDDIQIDPNAEEEANAQDDDFLDL